MNKKEKVLQTPIKLKWTRPIDKAGPLGKGGLKKDTYRSEFKSKQTADNDKTVS